MSEVKAIVLGDGQLARAIITGRPVPNVMHVSRAFLDVSNCGKMLNILKQLAPDVLINCTAFNDIVESEDPKSDALPSNLGAVLTIQDVAVALDVPLIHFCTHLVYPGGKLQGHNESSETRPRCQFGASKLRGTSAVLERPENYVFRTANVWSNFDTRSNLAATIYRQLQAGVEFEVDDSRVTNFTSVDTLVEVVGEVLKRLGTGQPIPPGLYNLADREVGTRYQFAKRLAEVSGFPTDAILATPQRPILEPSYCSLDCGKVVRTFGDRLFRWDTNLAGFEGPRA